MVACKWSNDECFYRALVGDVNKNLGKVKVRFIDYGNQSIEPFKNVREFPREALKYPELAKLVNLDGFSEHSIKDPQIRNRYVLCTR